MCDSLKFRKKIFRNAAKSAKFAKVFCRESFWVYGMCVSGGGCTLYPVTVELVHLSTERNHCLSIEGRWRATAE